MSFPAYPSYKDSGVEWLGSVPSNWRIDRISRLFAMVGSGTTPPSPDFYEGGEINWVTTGELREKAIASTVKRVNGSALSSLSALQVYPPGTLLIAMYGATIGRLGWLEQPACTNQACCAMAGAVSVSSRFAFYCLSVATTALVILSSGGGQPNINQEKIRAFRLPVPSIDEQVAIAAFLDRETAKIDALIEEQRRLIALLREKRQAVISHAVTKGLDPHTPMKDSGIEWLGEVPAHWNVRPVGSLLLEPPCYGVLVPDVEPGGVPMLRIKDMEAGRANREQLNTISLALSEQYRRTIVEVGDLVLSVVGTIGRSLIVDEELAGVNLSRAIARLRPSPACDVRYLRWAFRASFFEHFVDLTCVGTAQRVLNMGDLVSMRVVLPSMAEQAAIDHALTAEVGRLEALIGTAQSTTALLNERRAALISAAVTGRIDVRGSAEVLPFPIERARARALVGTEIIARSAGQPTFGRVKFQKVAFLAEGHVGISELAGCYTRAAAGPLDGSLIEDMERGAHSIAGIAVDQAGGTGTTVSYRLGQKRGAHRQELADWLGPDRTAKLDKLIADFAPLNTKQAEAVATLYGVWNDLLSEGATPSDDEIITGFLNDWHPEKRAKFRPSELPEWLDWMRRHGIVPTGSGPKTTTGRLFV